MRTLKSEHRWIRKWFSREMPLEDGSPLTVSFELYDNGVTGIHLGNCFDEGVLDLRAIHIINHFKSRTEIDYNGDGVYILVMGEPVMFVGFRGLEVRCDYLTGKTVVYEDIVENEEALQWFHERYSFFVRDDEMEYYSPNYFRQVSMDGDTLKITYPVFEPGERHLSLLSYGGKMLTDGFSMHEITMKLYDMNVLYCTPPLPYEDVERIIKSVKKYSRERDGERE